MMRRLAVTVSCAAAVALLGGCGVFKSSTSEASSESSSKSSSSCSPSGDKDSAYQRDIRDYTTAYAATGGDFDRFRRDLGAIAENHGITDWEADPVTLVAIGQGIGGAEVDSQRAQQLLRTLAGGDSARMEWIRQGYLACPQ